MTDQDSGMQHSASRPENMGAATPDPTTGDSQRASGWEVADAVAGGAEKVAHGIGWFLTKTFGLLLLVVGIIALTSLHQVPWWGSLLVTGYGVYLLFPGDKWVVW